MTSRHKLHHIFNHIISLDNLSAAWRELARGKRRLKPDMLAFISNLPAEIELLHLELVEQTYRHGPYHQFTVNDTKPRLIHKASIRDRLLHRAIYRQLYPFFAPAFFAHSYSGQKHKGTHRALVTLETFGRRLSHNHTRTTWVLTADIKHFFASIDQSILSSLLTQYISDPRLLWLLREVIISFPSGLPLGNLTSQLLVNVYLTPLDNFIKRELKVRYYLRYADDFLLLHSDHQALLALMSPIQTFLWQELKLSINPFKWHIKTYESGIDWLGWVCFPRVRVLRTKTRRRLVNALRRDHQPLSHYAGLLKWGQTHKLTQQLLTEPFML